MELIGILGFTVISIIAYNREEKIDRFLSGHSFLKKSCPFLICFIISFLVAVNFNLSPFNNALPGGDSSVFLYIGRSMYNGAVPYKDLFDHKGIVLYFIEYLGYLIGFGRQIGVWLIEWANIFATSLIFFYIAERFSKSRIICYLSTYIVLQLTTLTFFEGEGGNLTEEYALPWISLSLYVVVKFFQTKEFKMPHLLALGAGFTVVFFLRVNMVGLWGALIIAVLIYLVKSKRIADIFKYSLLFIAGCLLVAVPVMIYLSVTGSLKDMIDYYFVFNLSYTGSHSKKGLVTFIFYCIDYAGISAFFVVYSLVSNRRNKYLWLNALALLFAYLSAAVSGRLYRHYGIILIPFFIIPAVLSVAPLMEKTKEISTPLNKKSATVFVIVLSLLCVAFYPSSRFYVKLKKPASGGEIYSYLSKETTENDDVLFLGNKVYGYLRSNRHTKNKFFYQEPPIDVSDKLYDEFISELSSNPSDYIINLRTNDQADPSEEIDAEAKNNHQKVIDYLNGECEKGLYKLEKHNSFQVYVRKQ